ncbi:methyl-accepting chemotaxis protein [Ectothiorhodospiraceae bacterium BW-2]|nr:methyl-accepting chemotaxis protein [Ectothiorhodospiraceae bacterium BW-2]
MRTHRLSTSLLSHLSMNQKLALMLLIPLAAMLYFAATNLHQRWLVWQESAQLIPLVELSTSISALVHELQKERGMSAGYIGSAGAQFRDKLPQQHQLTDRQRQQLQQRRSELALHHLGASFLQEINRLLTQLERLDEVRGQVIGLQLPLSEALSYYTTLNGDFLELISSKMDVINNGHFSRNLSAYANFLLAKERSGIERAVLANTFAQDKFADGMYLKFSALVSEQNSYEAVFLSLATPAQISHYRQLIQNPVVQETERMRQIAFSAFKKSQLIQNLEEHIGYGGLIHHYHNYLLRGHAESIERFNHSYRNAIAVIEHYRKLDNLNRDTLTRLDTVTATLNRYREGLAQAIALKEAGATIEELMLRIKVEDSNAFKAIKQLTKGNFGIDSTYWFDKQTQKIDLLKQMDDWLATELKREMDSLYHHTLWQVTLMLTLSLAALILSLLLSATIALSVTRSLRDSIRFLDDIAEGEGDLTQRFEAQGRDEIAQMGAAFNRFSDKIETIVITIKQNASKLQRSIAELNSGNSDLAQRTESQAASLEQTASSMEQLTTIVRQNADNAELANRVAQETRTQATASGDILTQTTTAMAQINQASHKIANIISSIDEIAFQTNLLALNAAVEAARAGEQGRGFAVVAGEVRNLAQRSAAAAKEIKLLIEDSLTKVEHGNQLVVRSDESLREIINSVKRVSDYIGEITAASREQAQGISQVNQAISQMDGAVQQNASMVEQINALNESMKHEFDSLVREVGQFRVSDRGV